MKPWYSDSWEVLGESSLPQKYKKTQLYYNFLRNTCGSPPTS